jgi:hypothetical protein
MPQYWLKPFGTTNPPRRVDPNWAARADLESFAIISGPATAKKPPQMGGGDKILFHAVGHVRLYAAGELTGSPRYDPKYTEWGVSYLFAICRHFPASAEVLARAQVTTALERPISGLFPGLTA